MADDTLTLDEITVTAEWGNDDGDSDGGRPEPRPPTSFTQVLLRDPSAAQSKYGGTNGPVKAILDAAEKGTDYFIIGESHNDMATTFKTMRETLNAAEPGEIGAVTIEVPPYYNVIIADFVSGEITQADFVDYMASKFSGNKQREAATELSKLALTAKLHDVPLIGVDMGPRTVINIKERMNDVQTYNYVKEVTANIKGMTLLQQGMGHVVNVAGPNVKGLDDLAAADGKRVTTAVITTQTTINQTKEAFKDAENYSWKNDTIDLVFVGTKVSVGVKASSLYGIDRLAVDGKFFDSTIVAKKGTSSYAGTSKNDVFEDVSGINMKINGGSGTDTVSYIRSSSGVTVAMRDASNNAGNAKGDTYSSIENVHGSMHNDTLRGNDVANRISGDSGNDYLYGYGGNDKLYGGMGEDFLYGGDGSDKLFGEFDDDVLYGAAGNDTLYGGEGQDILYGEAGNDTLYGDNGTDKLSGGAGNDHLYGLSGNDFLTGGAGNDNLRGGSGSDLFMFGANDGIDHILDFQKGDSIFLTLGHIAPMPSTINPWPLYAIGEPNAAKLVQQGSDVKITYHETQIIVDDASLKDVKAALATRVLVDMA